MLVPTVIHTNPQSSFQLANQHTSGRVRARVKHEHSSCRSSTTPHYSHQPRHVRCRESKSLPRCFLVTLTREQLNCLLQKGSESRSSKQKQMQTHSSSLLTTVSGFRRLRIGGLVRADIWLSGALGKWLTNIIRIGLSIERLVKSG